MSGRPPPSFGGPPSAPQKGAFPLDHFGECKELVKKYLSCLKESKGEETPCREFAKQYLACRMERGLFEKEDWKNLGFGDNEK